MIGKMTTKENILKEVLEEKEIYETERGDVFYNVPQIEKGLPITMWVIKECLREVIKITEEEKEEEFKKFIKELKEELENILKINIENANKSGVSDKLKKVILEMMQGNIVEIAYRIDKIAGKELI